MPTTSGSLSDEQLMHAISVDDAYKTVRLLGSGATGVTELVTIAGSGPFVRKKIPREMAQRCVWAALGGCASPFLPRVWATYEMPEHFVVVCDYVAGETLDCYVSKQGRLSSERAAQLAADLCSAVSELHSVGIIHRDISPTNIIVSSRGAHLIDFGIAQMVGEVSKCESAPFGTWGFAAPEQYGFAPTDVRSDVHSIGRVLGFMATGVMPDDDGYASLLHDPSIVAPSLRAIVERACEFEPSARFQGASEMRSALLGGRPSSGKEGAASPFPDSFESTVRSGVDDVRNGRRVRMPRKSDSKSKRPRSIRIAVAACGMVGAVVLAAVLFWSGIAESVLKDDPRPSATQGASAGESEEGASSFYELGRQFAQKIGEDAAAAAAGGGDSSPDSSALEADCLEIVETVWYPMRGDYVQCVVGIRNVGERARPSIFQRS